MRFKLAAMLVAVAAIAGFSPAVAQEAPTPDSNMLAEILKSDIAPERLALGLQLVKLSGTGRTFDEVLPNIAMEAKNAFIRANPQMQLGIINVVDRVALGLVNRRPELDDYLARVWASGFTNEEMQELIVFYSSETGRKFAELHPQLIGVEMAAAQEWGRSVSRELTQKVSVELRLSLRAEEEALRGDTAGPAAAAPAEAAPAQ